MKRPKATGVVLLAALVVGCAHYQANPPLAKYDPAVGYRFGNCSSPGNSDATFIVLAFSGGGTRAAAFSFGVLEELRNTPLPEPGAKDGKGRNLIDEVDVISSVSGGSFTAAYFGLYGDRIFDEAEFRDRFLYRDVQADLMLRTLNPINLCRLTSPSFSRIDLAAEYYDQKLFHGQTFGALAAEHRRPFIILNATDMSLGARFEFTQNQFDLLMSDLNGVKIARGVAASSAFPFLLCPLTIVNYPKGEYKEPQWVSRAIKSDFEVSPRRWRRAAIGRSYFDSDRRYIHLLDGGISDNVGLRGPMYSLEFPDTIHLRSAQETDADSRDLNIQRRLPPTAGIRRLVFIVADAKPGESDARDHSAHTPGLLDVGITTASAPMANYSFETVQVLREYCDLIEKERGGAEMRKLKTYVIHLRFDGVRDEEIRQRLQGLGTNFHLSVKDVDTLRATAGQLLRESPAYQKLLGDLRKDTERGNR